MVGVEKTISLCSLIRDGTLETIIPKEALQEE